MKHLKKYESEEWIERKIPLIEDINSDIEEIKNCFQFLIDDFDMDEYTMDVKNGIYYLFTSGYKDFKLDIKKSRISLPDHDYSIYLSIYVCDDSVMYRDNYLWRKFENLYNKLPDFYSHLTSIGYEYKTTFDLEQMKKANIFTEVPFMIEILRKLN